MAATWRRAAPAEHPFERTARWGYRMGVDRLVNYPTQRLSGDVRADAPFRDERLLRLYSGFPGAFSAWGGVPRAPVRAMLRGNVPDAILTRPKGIPFCPDFRQRMRNQSGEALARLPAFRKAGLGEWVDIDWLEIQLQQIGAAETLPMGYAFQVQMTANVAELLMWWMDEG
jgi:asparagine synthase (glutamine-hydrolysing)